MHGGKRRVTVHVIFYGSIIGGFWSFLCRPGWRHCLLIMSIYMPNASTAFARRYSLIVNPCGWGLHVDVVWRSPEQIVAEFIAQGVMAVVKQTIELPPASPFIPRGLFSCVSILKATMGLRNWRTITPYGLFRFMVSSGAEVIFRSGEDGHVQRAAGLRTEAGVGAGPGDDGSAAARGATSSGGGGEGREGKRRAAGGD